LLCEHDPAACLPAEYMDEQVSISTPQEINTWALWPLLRDGRIKVHQ